MNTIKKINNILFHPHSFFSQVEKEAGINKAFLYFLILTLFSYILSTIITSLWPKVYTFFLPIFTDNVPIKQIFLGSFIGFLISLPLSFVTGFFLYLWVSIFGGKKSYSEAYKLYVYSITPKLVFGWIPLVNILIWIYSLILLIIGTQKIYKFSALKATLIYIIPLIIGIIIFIAILILGIFALTYTSPEVNGF